MSKHRIQIFLILFTILALAPASGMAQGIALDLNSIVKVNRVLCGAVNGVWVPGTVLRSGNFLPTSDKLAGVLAKLATKNLKPALREKLKKKKGNLRRALRQNSKVCAGINSPAPTVVPTVVPTPLATPATPLPGATTVAWNQNASSLASNLGGEYLYFCPANPTGSFGAIYGMDTYTADSPICVAAVHLGLFKRGIGGNVRFVIKGAQTIFYGSVRNGVQSNFYGPYSASYSFLDLNLGVELITNSVPQITWSQDAGPLYSFLEQQFTLLCPPSGGVTDSIWGTDIYTYDSGICTAAVHAGRISLVNGGVVVIQIKAGQASYTASSRNGINSSSYGSWGGSFIFVP